MPEGARAGDRLQVTVPQDVDVLEYLGVTEPKPPCVTSEESENSVAKELAGFTLPLLLLVWLASPLFSLVDTAAVGASRPTAELAVLGPACAACDNAAFLCTFFGHSYDGSSVKGISHGRRDEGQDGVGGRLRRRVGCRWVVDGGGLLAARACWFRSHGAPVDAWVFRGRRLYPYQIFGVCAGVAHHGAAIDVIGARAASSFYQVRLLARALLRNFSNAKKIT